jgi:NAD(P)H-hydrate epimerase
MHTSTYADTLTVSGTGEVQPQLNRTFVTDTGVRVPAVTADQMREIDRIAVEETGPDLLQMMENAGRELAACVLELLGSGWRHAQIIVLAGTGGNGGGGICAARHLANRSGRVTLIQAEPDRLSAAASRQLALFRNTSGRTGDPASVSARAADLIIDALIGYGLRSAPRGGFNDLIEWASAAGSRIVSLDIPSGLDATTGQAPGSFVRPTVTMTLALPKTGLLEADVGQLVLADIGLPAAAFVRAGIDYTPPFDHRFRVPLTARLAQN